MNGLYALAAIGFLLFIAAVWLTKLAARAQTSKSIGDLLNEESEANDALRTRSDVLGSDPATANRRLQDKWTRPE